MEDRVWNFLAGFISPILGAIISNLMTYHSMGILSLIMPSALALLYSVVILPLAILILFLMGRQIKIGAIIGGYAIFFGLVILWFGTCIMIGSAAAPLGNSIGLPSQEFGPNSALMPIVLLIPTILVIWMFIIILRKFTRKDSEQKTTENQEVSE